MRKKEGMSRRPGEKRPLFVFVGIAALAALPQDPAQRVPRHDASATVKLVPVRVLDADGRPVRGLRKEDFALFDNGERKTITEFEAHVSDRRLGGEAPPPGPAETTLPEVRRKYVFLLDMQASDLFGNRDAKRVVLEFIENELKPGDEASLMTFGGLTGLVLRQFLTSDLDKIKKAVERSVEMGGGGGGGGGMAVSGGTGGESLAAGGDEEDEAAIAARGEAQRAAVEGGSIEGQAGRPGTVLFKFRTPDDSPFGIRTGLRIEVPSGLPPGSARSKSDFDADLADLARAMKYMSGTKSLVFFSTRTPGKNVARLFAEAGATIYAVNTNSVPAKGGGAEAGGRREMKRRQGSALAEFAEATGGHYFSEVKEAAAIGREVEALSGNFYVLGYYITPAWDGGEHKIRVEVNKPGTRVLAQAAYNDPRPFAAMSAFEKDLHLFDLALAETPATADVLALPLRILTAETVEDANTAALFELAVDEKAGLPPGKTEIFTLIFDRDHAIVFGERGEVDTRPYAGKVLYPYFLAKLPPGEFECRVVARDLDTGQAASARRLVSVSAPIEGGIRLHPPLLFVPGREAEF
ncbi:MAG: VWA domain-containing protein, partial [Candidatus Aminicenantes bacterium]|nr:VWA domain-containing protein [Candidatus Aminicenantes bacterium]